MPQQIILPNRRQKGGGRLDEWDLVNAMFTELYGVTVTPAFNYTGLVLPGKVEVICTDTFTSSLCGWMQLYTPPTVTGTVSRVFRGEARCQVRTPNVSGATGMALKRLFSAGRAGRWLVEFVASIENVNLDTTRPQWYGWGLDTALADGTRRFFYMRWLNYSESLARAGNKFQLNIGGSYVDVPNGGFSFVANENKVLPVYIALIVNTSTGLYEGINVNNLIKAGSLAAVPDTSISALGGPTPSSLATFANGVNPLFDIVNRDDATTTAAASSILFHRLSYLGS